MAKVAVVILNYNGEQYLQQFLPSVINHSSGAEIIIADNASTDGSIAFLEANYPTLTLIHISENLGYAGGYNEAIAQIDHEYSILLNSDIEVTAGWIEPIIQWMDENSDMAACQPKILDFQDQSRFEYAGAAGGFLDAMGYPYCRGRVLEHLEKDEGQYDDNLAIDWATGACMFVRTALFKKAGGFDADFFAHMEEIDLCWRFRMMGFQIFCIPQSKVYHVGGGTLNKLNPRKTYLNFRNNLSLLFKNETLGNLLWKLPFKWCLDWAAAIKFGMESSWNHSWAIIRAQIDFILLAPKNFAKRKKVGSLRKTAVQNSSFLLPYQYFIKARKTFGQLPKP